MNGHAAVIAAYSLGLVLLLAFGLRTWLATRSLRRRQRRGPE